MRGGGSKNQIQRSGTKNEPKPKLFEPGYLPAGVGVFHAKGWGPKVRYALRNQGNQTFLAGYPGILPGYPGGARKVLRKKFGFNFCSLREGGQKSVHFNVCLLLGLAPFWLFVGDPSFGVRWGHPKTLSSPSLAPRMGRGERFRVQKCEKNRAF